MAFMATVPPPFPPPLTLANNGLGIFPFLCAVTGLVNLENSKDPAEMDKRNVLGN